MQYIFVDFDDTLCIHPNPIKTELHMFEDVKTACENFYSNSKVNLDIIDYLEHYKSEGAYIILLSACNSKMLEIKKEWCNINCPDLFDDYIGSSVDLSKSEIIMAFAAYKNVDIEDISLIDDNDEELDKATKMGIPAIDAKD